MRYEVHAHRQDRWWAIDVPALSAVHTQAAHWDDVETMAREAIALALDVDEADVEVVARPVIASDPDALNRLAEARNAATTAATDAHQAAVDAAVALVRREGLPMREAGRLLGLSHQRVHQLLADA